MERKHSAKQIHFPDKMIRRAVLMRMRLMTGQRARIANENTTRR